MLVSAIIPAYNEAQTIGKVLEVLKDTSEVNEIIVVSDGSEDETAQIAREYNVKVVELKDNIGKGGAMKVGVEKAIGDVILFLDADLMGLMQQHIKYLLYPVLQGSAKMTIGVFEGGRLSTDLAQKISPFLSGQRALRKEILLNLNNMEITKFGIEVALTNYVKNHEISYKKVVLSEITHRMKEEKLGFKKGVQARMKMYWEIVRSFAMAKYN